MLLPVAILVTRTGESNKTYGKNFKDISKSFYYDKNSDNIVDFEKLGEHFKDFEKSINIYYRIPDDLEDSETFYYRTKDIYTKVFIEDELLYETTVYDSWIYNKSPGNLWNSVKVSHKYAGKWMRVEITISYDKKAVVMDHVLFGDKTDIVYNYIRQKAYAIIISFIIITVGLYLLVSNIYELLSKKVSGDGNMALGLYALTIGIWSMCETNTLQMFFADGRMMQLIDNAMMFMGMLPMMFFIDSHYKILKSRIVRIICYLDLALLAYCIVVQYTDISDFHYTIPFAWVAFFVFVMVMLVAIIKSFIKKIKTGKMNFSNTMHIVGFFLLTVTGVVEAIRFSDSDASDRAEAFRLGILLFVICFAIGNQVHNYSMLEKGVKYELIKNLAYCDGLTGLGNRTSYLEKIKEYNESGVKKVGIVFLDINNLKMVNDTFGHEIGDKYILMSAEIIRNSFGKYGDVYRIGGDEFCVFIHGIDIATMYEEAKEEFNKEIDKKNIERKYDIEIQIAEGFTIYNRSIDSSFTEKINEADEYMYENKKKLKEILA